MKFFFLPSNAPGPTLPENFEKGLRFRLGSGCPISPLRIRSRGHELYTEYINTPGLRGETGLRRQFCVNEHHQNAYGLMPSPNIIAGAPHAAHERGSKSQFIGNALPLYNSSPGAWPRNSPWLDVMSQGRLIRGHGDRRRSGILQPIRSIRRTARREENSARLSISILKAWTTPGAVLVEFPSTTPLPLTVNPWPRPYQQASSAHLDTRRGQPGVPSNSSPNAD